MSGRGLLAAAVLLFALTVLARLPASWALAVAPSDLECQQPSGSLWQGACVQLRTRGIALNNVSWKLHGWSLLLGRLDVDLSSGDPRAPGRARIAIGLGGNTQVSALQATLPIDSGLLPLFPKGWSGLLQLDLDQLVLAGRHLAAVHGTVSARALEQRSPRMPFGSYELQFGEPPRTDGQLEATLRDSGGPLSVSGTLRIGADGQYELNGTVATRAEATRELVQAVEFLGAADAQGRRPFSLAGTI
jgi:hypothetical protein